jgi:hypothetical protein
VARILYEGGGRSTVREPPGATPRARTKGRSLTQPTVVESLPHPRTLSTWQANSILRRLRDRARSSGHSTARAELRVAWMSLVVRSGLGGPRRRWSPAALQLASETVARMVIEQMGALWGISRSTADAALGELRDAGLLVWDTPAPVLVTTESGTTACVGREVRRIRLTPACLRIVADLLQRLNPEIPAIPHAVRGGPRPPRQGAGARTPENAVQSRPPGPPPGPKATPHDPTLDFSGFRAFCGTDTPF